MVSAAGDVFGAAYPAKVIDRVRLVRYKGFQDFTLRLGRQAVLVGPNNAGKTTLVQSVRLAAGLLRFAQRRRASGTFQDSVLEDSPRWVGGYPIAGVGARELSWYKDENLRHEFRDEPTALEMTFGTGARLRAIWPVDTEAFFYVEPHPGMVARTPGAVSACTPLVGVVPTLGPVEHREGVLSAAHVRESVGTRLTSRHFRNQLFHLRAESEHQYTSFLDFALLHTPEITAISLVDTYGPGSHELDLYITELATHTEKEIVWTGDGLQVWLQVLMHTWLNRGADTLVLDEPDVYLHPDLQRRLVAMLDDIDAQIVIATHAPEILTEVSRDSVVWVDRTRRQSRRAKDSGDLARLNTSLGSGFNLGMARALRSRVALFVEGDDMKILRNIARATGAHRVRTERGLAVIPLGGFSNWHQVEPFAWLTRDLLGDAVKVFVILDRDHRPDRVIQDLVTRLATRNVHCHVWRRKELESYLLVPDAIARIARLPVQDIEAILDNAVMGQQMDVQAAFIAQRQRNADRGIDPQTVVRLALPDFVAAWAASPMAMVSPKELLATASRESQSLGGKGISPRAISASLRAGEVDVEMANLLASIELALGGS